MRGLSTNVSMNSISIFHVLDEVKLVINLQYIFNVTVHLTKHTWCYTWRMILFLCHFFPSIAERCCLWFDCIDLFILAAVQEMISIMQDYGEVVCCVGSSFNSVNPAIFIQADMR